MVVWDTHLPNGCVGRQAFPMEAEGRLADFGKAIYPRQSEGCFVSLIGDLPTGAEQWWRRSINQQRPPLKHTSPVPQVWQLTPLYESYRRGCSPRQVTPIRITISSIVHSSRLEHCSRSGRPPPNSTYFAGRLPTLWPSQGHRSRTLDLVPTGGLSRVQSCSFPRTGWDAKRYQSTGRQDINR